MSFQKSRKLIIAFDVNNTLSTPLVRQLFESLDRSKCHLIVWSSMGKKYAQQFVDEHSLLADEVLDKGAREVDIAVDDLPETIDAAELILEVRQ